MYLVKNALRNLWRSKGRSILMIIIVVVIATASCVSLCIQQAADTARTEGLKDLSVTGQISIDRQKLMQSMNSGQSQNGSQGGFDKSQMFEKMGQNLTLSEYMTYAKSQYVKSYSYQVSTSLDGTDKLEAIDLSGQTDTSSGLASGSTETTNNQHGPDGGKGFADMGQQGDFTLVGVNSKENMTDFVSGSSTISSGSIFSFDADSNSCLIHEDLATLNSLKVGDTITLVNPNNEKETFTLKISGFYTTTETTDDTQVPFSTQGDKANQIYMSYGKLESLLAASEKNATTSTDETTGKTTSTALRSSLSFRYAFESVEDYEAFSKDVYTLGLSTDYTVSSSDITAFEQSLAPLENLSKFAGIALWVVLGVGGIVLVVLNIFHVRERKYEMGVYTAIGMRKSKVAAQFITELFALTLVGVLLGAVVGSVISVPVSNSLLESQVASQQSAGSQFMARPDGKPGEDNTSGSTDTPDTSLQSQKGGMGHMFQQMGGGMVNYISSVNAAVNWMVLLELVGIAILLTVVSSLVAVISVLRYEPLKILSDRT